MRFCLKSIKSVGYDCGTDVVWFALSKFLRRFSPIETNPTVKYPLVYKDKTLLKPVAEIYGTISGYNRGTTAMPLLLPM